MRRLPPTLAVMATIAVLLAADGAMALVRLSPASAVVSRLADNHSVRGLGLLVVAALLPWRSEQHPHIEALRVSAASHRPLKSSQHRHTTSLIAADLHDLYSMDLLCEMVTWF